MSLQLPPNLTKSALQLFEQCKQLLYKSITKWRGFITYDHTIVFASGIFVFSLFTFESVRRIKGLTRMQLLGSMLLTTGAPIIIPPNCWTVEQGAPSGSMTKILPYARTRPSNETLLYWKAFNLGDLLNYNNFNSPRSMINNFRATIGFGEITSKGIISMPSSVEIKDFVINYNNVNISFTEITYPGASANNGVIVFLPGSAFIVQMSKYSYNCLSYISKYTGMKCYIIKYEVSPEALINDGFEQCYQGYLYVLSMHGRFGRNLFLCGDSAGGVYAMLILNKIKEEMNNKKNNNNDNNNNNNNKNNECITYPTGAILLSPPMDLSGQRESMKLNKHGARSGFLISHLLATGCIDQYGNNLDGFKKGDSIDEYNMLNKERLSKLQEWSPFYKDFSGMDVDTYWIVSVHEDLFDDTRDMVNKLSKESKGNIICRYSEFIPHTAAHLTVPECIYEISLLCKWINDKSGYENQFVKQFGSE